MSAPVDVRAELDALIVIRASRAAKDDAPLTAIGDLQRAEATRAAVAQLIEATKKMQRPLAELAHNAVNAEGMMSTRPITDFATGDVGPDYIAMACSALTESVAALARVGGLK